ncbi:MAG: hypothetical protein M0036_23510, partial [Desulfobacteraceae bacterium]|nr:hypothetical protein [Desulfobacteraceae bacterium]
RSIGPVPAMLLTSDNAATTAFITTFDSYIANALPLLMNFKAPGYFKVQACNATGCSVLSAADAGRAQFIHTESTSEVAQVLAPIAVYPMVRALATAPRGAGALSWCGMDLCGNVSGMAMSRIDITNVMAGTLPQIETYYENYEVGSSANANASLLLDGYMGGMQNITDALNGILTVSGDITFELPGGLTGSLFAWIRVDAGNKVNTGYFTVTYNGNAYKFTLPVNPTDGQTLGEAAEMISASSATYSPVATRTTVYPTPFSVTAPSSSCSSNEATVIKTCMRVQ